MAEFGKRARAAWGVLDAHLAGRRYVVGDRLTIADLSLCGYLFFDDEIGVDWARVSRASAHGSTRLRAEPRWKHPYALMPGHPRARGLRDRPCPCIETTLDPRDPRLARNRDAHGGAGRRPPREGRRDRAGRRRRGDARHVARGKLLPRERIRALLDPGSPFLELSQLAAYGMYDDNIAAAGIITGIGRVSGRECVIVCNDATVKGGTYYPMTVKKHLRAQEIARENRLPCIYLVDSGGANLPNQTEVFPDRDHFGRIFYNQATMSAEGIPQIAVVHGLVHRGRRLRAGDVRRVDHRARAGHDLPRRPAAREGGDRRDRQRRGARRRRRAHAHLRRRRSLRARTTTTRSRSRARSSAKLEPPQARGARRRSRRVEPRYAADELYGVINADIRKPYDVREVIARIVDGSELDEFKARYGTTLVTGFAHLWGYPVGIVANNGVLYSRVGAEGRALHRALLPARHPARVPAEHHRLHGRQEVRGRRHREGRREDGDRRVLRAGAEVHGHHRRQLRRRQLRHVRPRVRSALPVDVAERAHLGDGRRAGGDGAGDDPPRRDRGEGRRVERRRRGRVQGADPRRSTSARAIRTTRARACGTTASSTRRTRGACWRSRSSASLNRPIAPTRFGVFRM